MSPKRTRGAETPATLSKRTSLERGSDEAGDGASRRRGSALEYAILDAAWDVLTENGYAGFHYEAVAARAGTSRPVLYRRWPQRSDLLVATLARFRAAQPIAVPDTGNLRDDALGFLRNANAGRARTLTLIGVQLADYFRETGTSFGELRGTLGAPGEPSGFETIVARAVARGELVAAPRSARVVNLPFDLLRHDMFMTMRPVPRESIVEIVDAIWLPLLVGRAPLRTPAEPRKASRRGSTYPGRRASPQ